MNDNLKTGVYLGVAVGLAVVAAMSAPGAVEPTFFRDTGEVFFPEFTDANRASSLEVWNFDATTGAAIPFKVEKKKGRWTIPSHYDYPADAKDRMSKAAGLLIGLRKQSVRSDSLADQAGFGVVDPTETGLELKGRGERVTFKDSAGAVLADLIIGKEVEGRQGVHYVRLPGKKRTYTAKIDTELSTKFADWIERDLLGVSSYDLKEIVFDNYSVDERRGAVIQGEKVVMKKKDYDWSLEGLKKGEEIDKDKARAVGDTLADVKIVGVRPKPEGLTARLERAGGIGREILAESLARRGFFLSGGKLYSNEGDLLAKTEKGIVYTLKFGEIVYGSGETVTSGKGGDGGEGAAKEASGTADGKGKETKTAIGPEKPAGSHRYLMITAGFEKSLLDAPKEKALPKEHLDKRQQAREEIEKMAAAVKAYHEEHKKWPAKLAELTSGDKPALKELKKDPWDRDYVYEQEKDSFKIRSLAEDGKKDGEGKGQDIVSDAFAAEDALKRTFDENKEFEKKVEEGKKLAKTLTDRFGPWYYVIDAEGFAKLHLARKDLVKKKKPETKDEKK